MSWALFIFYFHFRRFFSDWVEREKITCFHFRHRIEKRQSDSENDSNTNEPSSSTNNTTVSSSYSQQVTARVHKFREDDKESSADKSSRQNDKITTCCCLVKIPSDSLDEFLTSFHRKHWLDSQDCELVARCLVAKIASDKQRYFFLLLFTHSKDFFYVSSFFIYNLTT